MKTSYNLCFVNVLYGLYNICRIWHVDCTSMFSFCSLLHSLTWMYRNLHIGRSSATGLLPKAEAPWSPWQPCHSDSQHWGRVSPAAALSDAPPALQGVTIVPLFDLPSHSRTCLFVKEPADVFHVTQTFFSFFHLFGRASITSSSSGCENLILQKICQKSF